MFYLNKKSYDDGCKKVYNKTMHVAYSVKKSHGEVAKCEKKKQFVVYMFYEENEEEEGASWRSAGSLTWGDDVCYFWYPWTQACWI